MMKNIEDRGNKREEEEKKHHVNFCFNIGNDGDSTTKLIHIAPYSQRSMPARFQDCR